MPEQTKTITQSETRPGVDYTEQLRAMGLEQTAMLLGKDGYLGEAYVRFLDGRLAPFISTLDNTIIKALQDEGTILMMAINMGMGHVRALTPPFWLGQSLGIPVDRVLFGDMNEPKIERHITGFIRNVVETGVRMYEEECVLDAQRTNMTNAILEKDTDGVNTWFYRNLVELVFALANGKIPFTEKDRHQAIMGMFSSFEGKSHLHNFFLRLAFGGYIEGLLENLDVNKLLITHPLLGVIVSADGIHERYQSEVVGTDGLVASAWLSDIPLFVETQEALAHLVEHWGEKAKNLVSVMDGFVSHLASLRAEDLFIKRRENLVKGISPIMLLTASGVAPVQEEAFKYFIAENADKIRKGELRVVIQAGFGDVGKLLNNNLNEFIEGLGLSDRILLHWHPTLTGAVEFVEAITWEESPIYLVTKGGEMARVAVALGIPHFVTGTVSEHEVYNVRLALEQDAPVILLPHIAKSIEQEVATVATTKSTGKSILSTYLQPGFFLEQHLAKDMNDALDLARDFYLHGKLPTTNRDACWRVLQNLVHSKGVASS